MLIFRVKVDISSVHFPAMVTFCVRKMILSSLPNLCSARKAATLLCDIQCPAY